ncbi:GNAT family N-acetyltransferase [Compostimonas suwonensis]|uniref:Putative acetyltransferase n=1 Tax=Compostimonas suwonensis TaxID=1048394 RepID=A0A2M9C0D2_9MICO|nr:GNAT family N-acetyltransferase [Compostimonas suwonensis]PJJ63793.1 putative acetyltransferase [Compostimonas suwonensis]
MLSGMWTLAAISPDSPQALELIRRHRAYSAAHSVDPADDHVLDVTALMEPTVAFFALRDDDILVAIGALKQLSTTHVELKSMHTRAELRGQGIGRVLVEALLDEARRRGFERVSLETGAQEGFSAARRLYVRAGFVESPPFADYVASPNSVYYSREL